ncbi:hypothetical protein [Psychrobium sp. 1_MG-2023]|uniref:hypothetical protein n=1 Tax=Psychrobium sp. 1_MG-2023 TaxID=3062624 RepID=UPI000C332D56|nr:hypothetical protein [Psychrobium sp. 1_MG-2023]MDP2561351.1 hypothetical protein [Psychrobium sp. 1_MG-2023]
MLGKIQWQKPQGEPNTGSVTDYSGMVYNKHHNQLLLFGGGHSATWSDAIYRFSFKKLSNQFSPLYPPTPKRYYHQDNNDRGFWLKGLEGENYPRPVGRHTYDLLVVNEHQPHFYLLKSGTGPSIVGKGSGLAYFGKAYGRYDLVNKQWKILDPKQVGGFGSYGGVAEYDPISKKIIGMNRLHIWAYDPATHTTERFLSNYPKKYPRITPYSGSLVYSAIDQAMYIFGTEKGAKHKNRISFAKLNLNRGNLQQSTLTKLHTYPKEKKGYPVFTYDSTNGLIIGGPYKNNFYGYNPITQSWQVRQIDDGKAGSLLSWLLAYNSNDNVITFINHRKHVGLFRWH